MVFLNLTQWYKDFNRKKLIVIIKNEVMWGVCIITLCIIAICIFWAANYPVQWEKYKDPFHEKLFFGVISGMFAIVTTMMSFIQIFQHFFHKTHHQSQKRIMRILAMVPLYTFTSWLSILFFHSAIYMEFIKSCFEAYIIYCFLLLLTKYLGGHRGVEEIILVQEHIQLPFPFCFIKPKPHLKWVWYFKFGLLQYTWINPTCAAIAVVLNLADVYHDGEWNFDKGYPYIILIINTSQTIALYNLVAFYENAKNSLKPFQPLPKFIVIKLIVFFIFWQTIFISVLARIGILKDKICNPIVNAYCKGSTIGFTIEEQKILLTNVLVCVEMFFFSIAHHWIFSWKPYADGSFKKVMESRFRQMNNNKDDVEPDSFIHCL